MTRKKQKLPKFSLARALAFFSPDLRARLTATAAKVVQDYEKAIEGMNLSDSQRAIAAATLTAAVNEATAEYAKGLLEIYG